MNKNYTAKVFGVEEDQIISFDFFPGKYFGSHLEVLEALFYLGSYELLDFFLERYSQRGSLIVHNRKGCLDDEMCETRQMVFSFLELGESEHEETIAMAVFEIKVKIEIHMPDAVKNLLRIKD